MSLIFRRLLLSLAGAALSSLAAGQNPTTDSQEFSPLLHTKNTTILKPGAVITSANLDQFTPWLDESVSARIRADEYQITLGEEQNMPSHPRYVDATKEHAGKTRLIAESGELENYQGGRPFPALDTKDTQAGIKAAWNMRYSYAPDETETAHFIWRYRDMERDKIERTLTMYGAILRYKHRHSHPPFPQLESNPAQLFSALYLRVNSPQDIRNTQLLIHRAERDSDQEQAWMYLNTQRRVRRISTGQKTDAFLGSDIMIEDFLGYNGRIRDMQWKLLGSDEMLLPLYGHSQLDLSQQKADKEGYKDIVFSGKGGCFPEVTWQLRKVYHLEATPRDSDHPLSKRHYIIDAASYAPILTRIYDRMGKLWKLGIVAASSSEFHLPSNKDWQGPITDAVSMIDLQAKHCTTLSMKSQLAKKRLSQKTFTTAYLRQMGR